MSPQSAFGSKAASISNKGSKFLIFYPKIFVIVEVILFRHNRVKSSSLVNLSSTNS